jgi:hypothetical protein
MLEESESISRRRRQTGREGNPGVTHAHELVALVAVLALALSVDLTHHETQLQAEQYA